MFLLQEGKKWSYPLHRLHRLKADTSITVLFGRQCKNGTMNPGHTHIDQSTNTLLFATCAKEVVTNAQVNVMMSDKALLKYLQRELVRLENELKLQD